MNNDIHYKPIVPRWVAEIIYREQKQDVFASHGKTKEWDEWKRKYSRKLKYARLNGWIMEDIQLSSLCELCIIAPAVTKVDYRDAMYDVCERCKQLAESEYKEDLRCLKK